MPEMIVKRLGINAQDGHPVIVLQEKSGLRMMPIWVGPAEFKAIAMAIKDMKPERPQTHDLMINALDALERHVSKLEITEISNGTFYARLSLSCAGKDDIDIDCRPSDGIALALRQDAPILVAADVIDAAGYLPPEETPTTPEADEEFKKFVAGIKPSDFAKLLKSKEKSEPPDEVDRAPGSPDDDEPTKPS